MLTPDQLAGLRAYVDATAANNGVSPGTELAMQLLAHIDAQAAELAEWHKLRDSNALHINLLRGMPARLTTEQLLHIAGDEYQRMATRISELELFLGAQSAERNIDSWPEWKRRLVRDIGGFSSIIADRSRDATRYRWLRDSGRLPDELDGTIIVGVASGESILTDEQLDASIDAAMAPPTCTCPSGGDMTAALPAQPVCR
ncbi:hypothetical protein AAFM71_17160 [Chromobacterium violaceum]|uniref:hypothetical protein n=1 Tax=Chromobacterium violaceum TaxID=536 RepID=UPI00385D01D3